jgi:hypothetical protein
LAGYGRRQDTGNPPVRLHGCPAATGKILIHVGGSGENFSVCHPDISWCIWAFFYPKKWPGDRIFIVPAGYIKVIQMPPFFSFITHNPRVDGS